MFNYIKNKAFNFWYRDEIESEFYQAVKFNEFKKVEFLLKHRDADPNTKDLCDVTVLHLAAKNGNTEIITILMNAGANTQAVDYLGYTPMDYALASEKPSSADLIAHIQNEMEEAESSIYLRKGEQVVEESWKEVVLASDDNNLPENAPEQYNTPEQEATSDISIEEVKESRDIEPLNPNETVEQGVVNEEGVLVADNQQTSFDTAL
ncbi:MAG: ankyrin repeat domain-containing protein [Candidatus Jidaibacter sp.]|jgi:hypothetical protein|nr:ankyrin repeat domain-containing protein [Candidatus Jidaibacter sp.]